jgi:hypothetical protein
LLGEAKDSNHSGAVSLEEVRQCAQAKVEEQLKPWERYGKFPSTIQVRGARNLIFVAAPSEEERRQAEERIRTEMQQRLESAENLGRPRAS